jgi:hypothetical protein
LRLLNGAWVFILALDFFGFLVLQTFFFVIFMWRFSENLSLTVVKRKGGSLISESKRHRIVHERSSDDDDDDITEMLVHEDWEN